MGERESKDGSRVQTLLKACGVVAIVLASAMCRPSPPPPPVAVERPNVLLIVLDTTRRDRLSCYGYDKPTTPALDRLAAEGTLYERCISAGSWTLPSHASIFTGLYPRDHGTNVENWNLSSESTTLAERLTEHGYRTAGFVCNPWIAESTGLLQGFAEFEEIWRLRKSDARDEHGAAMATEKLLAWIDANAEQTSPFFAFVNYLEPHTPYRPPQPFRSRFLPPAADPEVAYQDARLGERIAGLEQRGVLANTIVVVVADHGEQLGEHGMLDHKMSLYAENVHVPLIVRYPAAVPAGLRVQAQVQSNDVFPTILDLVGLPRASFDASARLPLTAQAEATRPYAFVGMARPTVFLPLMQKEWPDSDVQAFDRVIRAVQGPRFKYFWSSDGERRLFDLVEDPGEMNDLSGRRPEIERRLDHLLSEFHRDGVERAAPLELDPERREALRSLGYVN